MHTNKVLVRAVTALTLAAAVALPAALPAQSTPGGGTGRVETASAAIPTAANPHVEDSTWGAARITTSPAKAVSSAAATSNCDGCTAQSTSLQAVYFDGGTHAAADNTATAWSTCVGCSSAAVSVQLVIARGGQPLTVNNRSLALGAACAGCVTTAAAIQLVVAGETRHDLSLQARELITQVQTQLADRLAQPAADPAQQKAQSQSLADEASTRLEGIVVAELGAMPLQRNVDVQVGQ